jgi:hypothetical protein
MQSARFAIGVTVGCAALVLAAGCSSGGSGNGKDSTGNTGGTTATIDDVTKDLEPRLQEQFGDAALSCGRTDPFSGGAAAGPVREGNAVACTYMSDPTSGVTDLIWADVLVLMVADNSYVYTAAKKLTFDQKQAGATEPAPEWLYRDGLTCEQLTAPPTADTVPGPDFAGAVATASPIGSGLTYPQVVYYWLDTGQPAALDPSGEGRPCSESFDAAQVDELFADPITVVGTAKGTTWPDPPVTTYQIRATLAEGDGLPAQATQVDCSVAGPVTKGSVFSCAPRLNSEADASAVAVVDNDGGFIVGPTASQLRTSQQTSTSAAPAYYATGLTCEQVRAPVTEETFNTDTGLTFPQASAAVPGLTASGLDYFNAVLYAFGTSDASKIDFDESGWPCTVAYPSAEVAEVTGSVQYVTAQGAA